MKVRALVKISMQSILRNKLRTLLTMLGIIIGVGAVMVMVAIGEGARHQIQDKISKLGTNMIVVMPGANQRGGINRGGGSFRSLTLEDAEKIKRESLLVSYISPVLFTYTQIVSSEDNWRGKVQGVDVDYGEIRAWPMEAGVFFNRNDVRNMRKVAVIGKTIADSVFPRSDPLGQIIRIRNVPVQIIGVLSAKGQTPDGVDQDDAILMPYTTFQNRLGGWSWIQQILVSTANPESIPAAQQDIRLILRESHRLSQWEPDDFTISNQADIAEAAQGTTEVMTLLLAAIASISLLVGGIGIMNIMLVSVTERTREIGIRMAIGARGRDVLIQFLVESLVMSLCGGLLGLLVGALSTTAVAWFTGWPILLSPKIILLSVAFSAAVGIFFGLYPARQAAALNPIEALRYE